MFRKQLLAAPFIITLIISGGACASNWDGPWKDTVSPHLNIYKFLKNFTNQKSRERSSGRVVVDRYYQNGKYSGYTSFSTGAWFSWTEPKNIKERFNKLIANVPGARMSQAKEIVFGSSTYGIYLEHNGCIYLRFYTRIKASFAANDDGNGDTIGQFKTCEGFTVLVKEFIHSIDEASEEDAAGLQLAIAETKRKADAERKAEAKRRAEDAERKRQLAKRKVAPSAPKRKTRVQTQGDGSVIRALLEEHEKQRQLSEARRKELIEQKKQADFFRSAPYAKQFLADVKTFGRANPGVLDPLTLATLYFPAVKEVSSGKFKNAESKFFQLAKSVKKNEAFSAYHSKKVEQRKIRLEAKRSAQEARLQAQRKASQKIIRTVLARMKQRIAADPFSPDAAKLGQLLARHKSTPSDLPLAQLKKRVRELSAKAKGLGIEVPSTSRSKKKKRTPPVASAPRVQRGKPLTALKDLGNNDVLLLANVGRGAKHAFRDLRGNPSFDRRTVLLCAPALTKKTQYQSYLQSRLNKALPDHKLIITKRCARGFKSVDAIFASGADFARGNALPASIDIKKKFQRKSLVRMLKIKKADFDRELVKKEILSSQYKSDVASGARQGFGALSLQTQSEVGCVVEVDETLHAQSLAKVKAAHSFRSGVNIKSFARVNALEAFKQAQRGNCGFIYSNATGLQTLLNAAKNTNLALSVLPVWTSPNQLKRRKKELLAGQSNQARSERERLADLKHQQIEAQNAAAAKAARLSEKQRKYRATHGAKVASLVAGINKNVLSGRSYWDNIDRWRADLQAKGWVFDSTVPRAVDYGFAKWRGRKIEAIIAEIRFSKKHPDLGEYKQSCWILGYLNDTEFSRIRDLLAVPCSKYSFVAKWRNANTFDTRWKLLN